MTLDLDELERLSKIAEAYAGPVENNGWSRDHLHPSIALALVERVRAAEAQCAQNSEHAQKVTDRCARLHADVAKAQERILELGRVAKAVEDITADAAENGRRADCPFVGRKEAAELLAIIRKGR